MLRVLSAFQPLIVQKSFPKHMSKMTFSRLVRFKSYSSSIQSDEKIHGEMFIMGDISESDPLEATEAQIIKGNVLSSYTVTFETAETKSFFVQLISKMPGLYDD
jgi:hypothetical protein